MLRRNQLVWIAQSPEFGFTEIRIHSAGDLAMIRRARLPVRVLERGTQPTMLVLERGTRPTMLVLERGT